MALLSFTAAPVSIAKEVKKKAKQAKGQTQKRKKVDMGATIYGDELFQQAYKPTKAIVVKFHPFTLNLIRMDTEGRFAIQYFNGENSKGLADKFLLYRFLTPIEFEYKEEEYQINISENVKTYGPFETVENIRDKILEILRRQILEAHIKAKQLAIDTEKAVILAKEKAQDESDKITEQLASGGISSDDKSSQRETEIKSEKSTQEKNISQEIVKKENSSTISIDEIRKPTANFITEVAKITDFKDLNRILPKEKKEIVTNFVDKTEENSIPDFANDRIVSIWKREGNNIKFIVKMPKSKAEKWIEGKANFYIREK